MSEITIDQVRAAMEVGRKDARTGRPLCRNILTPEIEGEYFTDGTVMHEAYCRGFEQERERMIERAETTMWPTWLPEAREALDSGDPWQSVRVLQALVDHWPKMPAELDPWRGAAAELGKLYPDLKATMIERLFDGTDRFSPGDVMLHDSSRPVPDGWAICDGIQNAKPHGSGRDLREGKRDGLA